MTLKPHEYPLPKANCGHKGGYKMKITLITKIALLGLLIIGLAAGLGCDAARGGGAEIWLEGVNTGAMSADGKPISGLPSQQANIVLKVSAKKINVSTSGDDTILDLSPSGGSIIISPDGISLVGIDPDKIEMKWETTE